MLHEAQLMGSFSFSQFFIFHIVLGIQIIWTWCLIIFNVACIYLHKYHILSNSNEKCFSQKLFLTPRRKASLLPTVSKYFYRGGCGGRNIHQITIFFYSITNEIAKYIPLFTVFLLHMSAHVRMFIFENLQCFSTIHWSYLYTHETCYLVL